MAEKPKARLFEVESHFQRMARRPGGVARETAIAKAQDTIEKAKPDFVAWVSGEIQALSAAVKQAEASAGDSTSIDQVAFHGRQLRDVGSTMGFELVTFVAGNLCSVLETIRAGARYDKDAVDCHVDALSLAVQLPYRKLRPDQLPELSGGLQRVLEKLQVPDGSDPGQKTASSEVGASSDGSPR